MEYVCELWWRMQQLEHVCEQWWRLQQLHSQLDKCNLTSRIRHRVLITVYSTLCELRSQWWRVQLCHAECNLSTMPLCTYPTLIVGRLSTFTLSVTTSGAATSSNLHNTCAPTLWGRVPLESWGAGVEYHFQEFNEPTIPAHPPYYPTAFTPPQNPAHMLHPWM